MLTFGFFDPFVHRFFPLTVKLANPIQDGIFYWKITAEIIVSDRLAIN